MKIGFISDTHGNLPWTEKGLKFLENCDEILHLGDVLAHGPRNAITEGYNPKALAELLEFKDNIHYIRGNCDADVDEMVLDKDLSNYENLFEWDDLIIYAIHGYKENELSRLYKAEELGANVLVTGHSHIKNLDKIDNLVVLNPGSTTLPKDGIRSVAIYEDRIFKLINIENGEVIKELKL
ncbi:MAG: phosphodiesterase [Tissierellia bacterium]|jgi:putative phosphoesterase|nr:phosphodiesterase [Tissierellia bacterium]